ncbi:hypothetical protein SDC9_159813 [bioreactor metagenome]|uniref:Uncharacterized protein n=1 Tax=bioreactor metagenome TaxID=1076179 RepID=A0A645FDL6_9ZZZZ
MLLQVTPQRGLQPQLGKNVPVPLKNLDGIPPEHLLGHLALDGLLNVSNGVLHAAVEH